MVQPLRSVVNFPMNTVTAIVLFAAASNLTLMVAAIAIQHFALFAMGAINVTLLLLAAYHSRKYIVLQINITPVYAHGPLSSITLDGYTITSERAQTPSVTNLSASMIAPSLLQTAQTGPANNPAHVDVIARP